MPRQVSRERITADIPTHLMRQLDAMASNYGINRTSMLAMCISERYDALPQIKKRELHVKHGGPKAFAPHADIPTSPPVDAGVEGEIPTTTLYSLPDFPGRVFTQQELDVFDPENGDTLEDLDAKMALLREFDGD